MGNMEFRYKRFGQYLGVVFLIPFIIFLLSMFFPLIDIRGWADRISVGDYPSIWGVIGFLVMASLVLLEIRLFVSMVAFGLSYKITITNTDLVITGWDFWGRKLLNQMNHGYYLGKIPYESINSISLDAWKPGVLKLTFHDGSYIFLPSRALENHIEFIGLLSEKLVNAQGLEALARVNEPKRFKHLQTFIYSLAYAPTIVLMFFMLLDNYEPRVWNEELTSWSIHAISPDFDGTVWVATETYNNDYIYIWQISETKREHWTFPKEACNYCDFYTIGHDLNGNPILFTNEKDPMDKFKWVSGIYTWNGKTWDRSSIELMKFSMGGQISMGTRLWGIKNNNLTYIDFEKNEIKEISTPDEVLSYGLEFNDIKVNLDGTLLVKVSAKDKPTAFYQVKNENWQLIFEGELPTKLLPWGFCQDGQGNIWVLTTDLYRRQPQIGFYDIQNSQWSWKDLILGQPDRPLGFINDMTVDTQGRLWITGVYTNDERNDFLDFVIAANSNENLIAPVIEYTEKNSNLEFADFFIATKDRVWHWRSSLYWIDTNKILPSPLPDWVVWMKNFQDENFGWYFPILIGQFILALIGASLEYK